MIHKKLLDTTEYRGACLNYDDMSGKTLMGIIKTVEMVRVIYSDLFGRFGISEPKFSALLLLRNAPEGLTMSDIGIRMSVSRANITGLIERLEKDGLVRKQEHPGDKRSTVAHLTEKGSDLLVAIQEPYTAFVKGMTETLTEDEKQVMNSLMHKMQHHMLSHFEGTDTNK